MQRIDGRYPDQLRPVQITRRYLKYPEGSALVEVGNTRVLCTAMAEERLPGWMKEGTGGWITAEYSMLPGSTATRKPRESSLGKVGGRTQEIQRLIGRSLRAVCDLSQLGPMTIWIDCDVLQADGGTRTAAITGAFVALADALAALRQRGAISGYPLRSFLAATSVGLVNGEALLDLSFAEDSVAEVDMNLVMTGDGRLVEIQGSAERSPFDRIQFDRLLALGETGISQLIAAQRAALGADAAGIGRRGEEE
ncbi:MAG: ribonuclease PH [Bacillota bacterium]